MVRRALLVADPAALSLAFVIALVVFGRTEGLDAITEALVFLAILPVWVLLARLEGLYAKDEERTEHSTVDEFVGVLHLVTLGAFVLLVGSSLTSLATPNIARLATFWACAIVLVISLRALARSLCRRSPAYIQNTAIVGAGHVGQLVARNLLMHPEYGIRLVGFVDDSPRELRPDVASVPVLGRTGDLPAIVRELGVERVVVAFSGDTHERVVQLVQWLRASPVQVDIVPRLFDVMGPKVELHAVQGLPLLGLAPTRLARGSRVAKRIIDLCVAGAALVAFVPLFAWIALRIRLDSPGPVLFRQTRVGMGMREFTLLKFRTMKADTDSAAHREFVRTILSSSTASRNGLYKLDREECTTPFGRWLRGTSLDELPQLVNVLRGEMSLVGPRPCLPYETEHLASHHFERFLVPAGITGLWQVTARAGSSFGEALELDVAYVRSWSLGLDLRLLCKTPLVVLRQRRTV
jgi:exopolysaccharide biosynthesis polyprenyl glycosylphosphotransferase